MTPSQLKQALDAKGSFFFNKDTMQFHGDTMKNYGCRSATIEGVDCWELYRKRPNKEGSQVSSYFNKETLKRVFD